MYAPDQNVTRLPIRDDSARGFQGGCRGSGSADERWRAFAARGADGSGSAVAYDRELAGRLLGLRRASPLSRSFSGVNTGRRRSEIPAARFLARCSLLLIRVPVKRVACDEQRGAL